MPFINKLDILMPLSALALSAFTVFSTADTVTLEGDSINYQYDDVDNAFALQLFGTPTIIGDAVRFLPPVFRAESVNGAGADVLTANFIFSDVFTQNGHGIIHLEVFEFGDYEISRGGTVGADLFLTASSNRSAADFSSDRDSFDASGASSGLQSWDMSVAINPEDDFIGAADNLAVSLQNTLSATTDEYGEAAWIQKKLVFTASTATTASSVPVPGAAWLFASALIGMAGIGRRR